MSSRDSTFTYLHTHHSHHADIYESFTHPTSSHLSPEEIYIPPHLQPVNPEDEDDVVPDQHAAFGIQRATQGKRETSWRDLGLEELVRRGPGDLLSGVGGASAGGVGSGSGGGAGGGAGSNARGLIMGTRGRDEPVALALRRRPGAATGAGVVMPRVGEVQAAGGGAGNGLPR